ncbi:MAG: hypothetical protein BWX68_03053 [Verrucomicrobia bacterium ADurb.Bin063]|nr:MAG: hypothetical protein BWX68_03053 [Verrucomicrobia bacterium ADurb.Bin063]
MHHVIAGAQVAELGNRGAGLETAALAPHIMAPEDFALAEQDEMVGKGLEPGPQPADFNGDRRGAGAVPVLLKQVEHPPLFPRVHAQNPYVETVQFPFPHLLPERFRVPGKRVHGPGTHRQANRPARILARHLAQEQLRKPAPLVARRCPVHEIGAVRALARHLDAFLLCRDGFIHRQQRILGEIIGERGKIALFQRNRKAAFFRTRGYPDFLHPGHTALGLRLEQADGLNVLVKIFQAAGQFR